MQKFQSNVTIRKVNAVDDLAQWRYPGEYEWFGAEAAIAQRCSTEVAPAAELDGHLARRDW